MKFLYLDEFSARELVLERTLQSAEFPIGKSLAQFVKNGLKEIVLGARVAGVASSNGSYIIYSGKNTDNYIVFDYEEARDLLQLDDNGFLLVLQKTLRFAIKLWDGNKPSAHELVLANGKAVVFPYPIGMQTDLRVAIERNPDEKRRAKRETGLALLVYKFSNGAGNGVSEEVRTTNFRRSLEERVGAYEYASQVIAAVNKVAQPGEKALAVTSLENDRRSHAAYEAGLNAWMPLLTQKQQDFVKSRLTVPHRIEGPAGTGKTLSLVLKCLKTLEMARDDDKDHRSLFVAHSEATKKAIENLFSINDEHGFFTPISHEFTKRQEVRVATLQSLCSRLLHQDISETELVDKDAYESKMVQGLYAAEAVDFAMQRELASHKPYLSNEFIDFLSKTEKWVVADMLQHEISVQIKGRAGQNIENYKKLARLKNGFPLVTDGDKIFVFLMHEKYQAELENSNQYDTDDVVLSAMSQLTTPIWRRRRVREGYDSIFVDETHLFNVNELSIFHRLTRAENSQPIAYSVDRSQALGDRGWTDSSFEHAFDPNSIAGDPLSTDVKSIFRCSPDIVNLAFSVTASGATLFTDFHNPMVAAQSIFTAEEERKCEKPTALMYASDELMMDAAFSRAEAIVKAIGGTKADVAVIAFGNELFGLLQSRARTLGKPVEVIKSRGDLDAVNKAKVSGRFVLTAPEYVGGLEFSAVVLVGVDGGRVPPRDGGAYQDSQNYLNYASHQRVYVALTRAKYRVEILGARPRGLSPVFSSAVASELLTVNEV
ncbi:UvrD-helicase domain-containing protein [Comamonas sediminis]|uniref:UvrD-helicase domain-containing protein n=1 Tax=Comamonas sediminis TaxID=1783360 RepID=A0ABV4B6G0_9BURK